MLGASGRAGAWVASHAAVSTPDAGQTTAGTTSDQRRERGNAFLASAQRGPSETNIEQWDPLTKLSAPLVDKFCTRTERSLDLAMAFIRRKIYWVVKAVAFLLTPPPHTAQALASWVSG